MSEQTSNRYNARLPLYGFLAAVIPVLPTMIFGNDVATFLTTIPVAILLLVILFVILFRTVSRHGLAALSMIVVFVASSWLLFKGAHDVRTTSRWLLQSSRYKAAILAQPTPPNGELKHAEWDIWGFAGAETIEYVVFDPDDSLAPTTRSRTPGKLPGIPCPVPSVHHLQSHWYTVQFYTDTDWNHCS